jgi:hypothetical protein
VLAGFLSTAERWGAFSDEWKAELDREPTLESFKMQKAMTGGDATWRAMRQNTQAERMDRFRAIIHRHAMLGFACVVHHDAYERLIQERFNSSDTVYSFAFVGVIGATMRYHREQKRNDKVSFVFAEQKREFRQARDVFERIMEADDYLRGFVSRTPQEAKDDDVLPLQAADYLAWQIRRIYADRENPAAARPLTVFPPGQYVIEEGDIPVLTIVLDAALLQNICDEKTADDLKTLEAQDMPERMKDYFRRVLTARLRAEPRMTERHAI